MWRFQRFATSDKVFIMTAMRGADISVIRGPPC